MAGEGEGKRTSLGLEGLSVGGDEDGGHEAERAEALGNDIGLDITVVVLHGDDVAALGLEHVGDHVVDEAVLVPDILGLEFGLVGGVVDLLKDVLELAIVLLQDGVLGGHVERELAGQRHLERGVCETADGLLGVVHGERDTGALVVVDLNDLGGAAVLGGVHHLELTGAGDNEVLGLVLVTEGVAADGDGLLPAGDKAGDVVNDNGLTEDGTAKDVSDGCLVGSVFGSP